MNLLITASTNSVNLSHISLPKTQERILVIIDLVEYRRRSDRLAGTLMSTTVGSMMTTPILVVIIVMTTTDVKTIEHTEIVTAVTLINIATALGGCITVITQTQHHKR